VLLCSALAQGDSTHKLQAVLITEVTSRVIANYADREKTHGLGECGKSKKGKVLLNAVGLIERRNGVAYFASPASVKLVLAGDSIGLESNYFL
jgi:hypothetical protein